MAGSKERRLPRPGRRVFHELSRMGGTEGQATKNDGLSHGIDYQELREARLHEFWVTQR